MQAKSPQVGEASFEAGSSGPPSRGRSCSSEAALDLLVGVGAVSAFKRSPIVLDGAAASSLGGLPIVLDGAAALPAKIPKWVRQGHKRGRSNGSALGSPWIGPGGLLDESRCARL